MAGRPRMNAPRYRGGRIKPDATSLNAAIVHRLMREGLTLPDLPAEQLRYMYVIVSSAALVKVGFTANLDGRLRSLQVASSHDLKLQHVLPIARDRAAMIEKRAHDLLSSKRMRGEWFAVHPATAYEAILRATREAERADVDKVSA